MNIILKQFDILMYFRNSSIFGCSTIDIKAHLHEYFDNYIANKLRNKVDHYINITNNNRSNYYVIMFAKIFGKCIIARNFRQSCIDSKFGMYFNAYCLY